MNTNIIEETCLVCNGKSDSVLKISVAMYDKNNNLLCRHCGALLGKLFITTGKVEILWNERISIVAIEMDFTEKKQWIKLNGC